jgi:hypothetical protein
VSGTPVLWLVGALGTGKSDTSYHLFSRLWRQGVPIARLDLDDLGMCHPAPDDDPDNHRVKAEAMAAAWSVFRKHSAKCLVVSGGVNTSEEVELHTRQLPDAIWTICRLRIGVEERRRRIARRGELLALDDEYIHRTTAAGVADESTLNRQTFPDLVLDSDGLGQHEVVDLVLARTGWPLSRANTST